MATLEQVTHLRRVTGYADTDPYDDSGLSAMIDADGVHRVAERLWAEKAAATASLVDVSESGSSRSLGDVYKNALAMSQHFKGLADAEDSAAAAITSGHARTRAVVREG
jgi:hypothetical protein